jgi:hypothetical protein
MRLATDAHLAEEYFLRLKLTKTRNINNNNNSPILVFFNVWSQQTDGQLQQQHNIQAKLAKNNKQFLCFVDRASLYNLVTKPTWSTIPSLFVYFYSLHVSGNYVPSSGEITVSIRHLVFVTLCG